MELYLPNIEGTTPQCQLPILQMVTQFSLEG
jgi:hypothetical protein